MVETTGGFTSADLLREEVTLALPALGQGEAIEIGEIALAFGRDRALPIAVQVRIGEWIVFHASLVGSKPENDSWLARKAAVVNARGHSTLYERVLAEEQGIDWYSHYSLSEDTHAIHGGGIALIVTGVGHVGTLLISGLPQVDDHLLGVEVLTEFLARRGEVL